MIYKNLQYHYKHNSFGDILPKFGANWTFVTDSVHLLSSTP